jgi:tellurite methyltransferase
VARLNKDAQRGIQADIESWTIDETYDTIVAIGLLMFFRHETALRLLSTIQERVKPGGRAVVNVLIEGTTYLGMFDPG